jgi:hypothetical protein
MMLRAVDADTHIFESPAVWDFLDEAMHARRPIIVSAPKDTVYKRGSFWLIDGNIFPKSAGKGGFLLGTPTEPGQIETTPDVHARELLDIVGRLEAMDAMGVDIQVIYPTLSGQPEVFTNMRSREDIGTTVVGKLLSDNARKLYGLPRLGV